MNTVSVNPLPASVRHEAMTPPVYSSHLDLLRGTAAIIVMCGHLRFHFEDLGRQPQQNILVDPQAKLAAAAHPFNYMNPAHQAVILFFVLSGALVGGSILREYKRHRFSWVSYYTKRLSRLLTVLIPALVIGGFFDLVSRHILASGQAAQFGALSDTEFNLGLKTFLGNLFFLQNLNRTGIPTFGSNAPLWSLSFEFWFYVLFPLLIAVIFTRLLRPRILFLLLFLITAVFVGEDVVFGLLLWSLGALVTLLPLAIPERAQRFAVAVAFALYGCAALFLWKHPFSNIVLDDYLLGLAVSILVYVILHRREIHSRTVYVRVTERIALMSFTVYLFHFPLVTMTVLFVARHYPSILRQQHRLAYFGIASLTYFICYLFYLAFERNTDRVRTLATKLLARRPHTRTEPLISPR
ncbi:MAG TPA: acyltransferase [Acidobacteriaceae bacterium]|jgi:peptidoglycan/LPS O-acetylase OafA/YrhL|nr:acyltransferase [Acidobacteriaceae bacterium]